MIDRRFHQLFHHASTGFQPPPSRGLPRFHHLFQHASTMLPAASTDPSTPPPYNPPAGGSAPAVLEAPCAPSSMGLGCRKSNSETPARGGGGRIPAGSQQDARRSEDWSRDRRAKLGGLSICNVKSGSFPDPGGVRVAPPRSVWLGIKKFKGNNNCL
jgi:hypothetical protein